MGTVEVVTIVRPRPCARLVSRLQPLVRSKRAPRSDPADRRPTRGSTPIFTGTPHTWLCGTGSRSMRTMRDDEPFTSHRPRHPCAPHPHAFSWSSSTCCTDERGTVARNAQVIRTVKVESSTLYVRPTVGDAEHRHGGVRTGESDREACHVGSIMARRGWAGAAAALWPRHVQSAGARHDPAAAGFRMPAEWAPHAGCLMAWPSRAELWGDRLAERSTTTPRSPSRSPGSSRWSWCATPARRPRCATCAARRHAARDPHQRLVEPRQRAGLRAQRRRRVAVVGFGFNAWGNRWHPHDDDARLSRAARRTVRARRSSARRSCSRADRSSSTARAR